MIGVRISNALRVALSRCLSFWFVLAVLYMIFGHALIGMLYSRSAPFNFLNRIIEGQNIYPIEHYYAYGDHKAIGWSIGLFLFLGALAFAGVTVKYLSAHKRFAYAAICSFGATVLSIMALEFIFSLFDRHTSDRTFTYSQPFTMVDPVLGYKPIPNNKVSVTKMLGTSQVYSVTYTIDECGRRCVPVEKEVIADSGYICLFGCSFAFGEGVADHDTLAFFLAQKTSAAVYNYGFCGYGPQHMLCLLKSGRIKNEIPVKDGVFLYLYLADVHERRVVGGSNVHNGWGQHMPCYVLAADGSLINTGDFTSGRPCLSKIYRLMGRSAVLKFFKLNLPLKIEDKHVALAARIIKESKELIFSQFTPKDFYVVIYPSQHTDNRMRLMLNAWGIKCLDYSSLFDNQNPQFVIHPLDHHPSGAAYSLLAGKIAEDLVTPRTRENAGKKSPLPDVSEKGKSVL